MSTQRRTTVWVDANGATRAFLLNTSSGAASVQAAIAALSRADVEQYWEGDLVAPGSPAPVAATYQSVRVVAELLYQTASGALQKVLIPAPTSAIFMPDGETVDPTAIAALTVLVLANVTTADGTALTAYVAGVRSK